MYTPVDGMQVKTTGFVCLLFRYSVHTLVFTRHHYGNFYKNWPLSTTIILRRRDNSNKRAAIKVGIQFKFPKEARVMCILTEIAYTCLHVTHFVQSKGSICILHSAGCRGTRAIHFWFLLMAIHRCCILIRITYPNELLRTEGHSCFKIQTWATSFSVK